MLIWLNYHLNVSYTYYSLIDIYKKVCLIFFVLTKHKTLLYLTIFSAYDIHDAELGQRMIHHANNFSNY